MVEDGAGLSFQSVLRVRPRYGEGRFGPQTGEATRFLTRLRVDFECQCRVGTMTMSTCVYQKSFDETGSVLPSNPRRGPRRLAWYPSREAERVLLRESQQIRVLS